MGYKKHKGKIALRAEGTPYEERAPGLYEDEYPVELDDGTLLAVSVERKWLGNGAGIAFHAYARHIGEDGATVLAPNDNHVESAFTFNCDPITLDAFGEDAIATDLARIVMGEAPQLMRDVPVDEGAPIKVPVVNLSEEVVANASIRAQIRAVKATEKHTLKL